MPPNETNQLLTQEELETFVLRFSKNVIDTIIQTNPKQADVLFSLLKQEQESLQQSQQPQLAKMYQMLLGLWGGLSSVQILRESDDTGRPH